jgi:hypothetical protein
VDSWQFWPVEAGEVCNGDFGEVPVGTFGTPWPTEDGVTIKWTSRVHNPAVYG